MTISAYVAIGAALSQIVLTAMLLLQAGIRGLSRKLYALLLFGTLGFLLIPLSRGPGDPWLLYAISTLVPGTFWLFSASLFDDHYEFPLWQPTLVAFTVAMPTAYRLYGEVDERILTRIFVDVPQFLEFVVLGLALHAIFRNWRSDLVVRRRLLRLWFCGITGIFIFAVILAREVLFNGAPWLESAQYIATAVVLTGTNVLLLRFMPDLLDPIRRDRRDGAQQSETDKIASAIDFMENVNRLINDRGLYRETGMTIGRLAVAVEIPEYRLRRLINSGLGYRNFNDFLNSFRIREASLRLSDPDGCRISLYQLIQQGVQGNSRDDPDGLS